MYEFYPVTADEKDLRLISRLLQLVFPKSTVFTEAYLNWEYVKNPLGKIVGFNAFEQDQLAAHYVAQPLSARVNGTEQRGLLSLNTATHPQHQGKKLFTTLADKTYTLAAELGFKFVIGVANANSTPGFINKLGFQLVGPLEARVGFGKTKKNESEWNYAYERRWDTELLRWRLANPQHSYTVSAGQILAPTGTWGIQAVMGEFDEKITAPFRTSSKKINLNPLKVWIGIDGRIRWNKSWYAPIPQKLKPSPLNLIFKDLTGKGITLDVSNVKFQTIDFDAY
jgi:hypothetical protein